MATVSMLSSAPRANADLEERRVDVDQLRLGMYVCRLDRPWADTPFDMQGLQVASNDDISTLQELCEFVYVDAQRALPQEVLLLQRTDLSAGRFNHTAGHGDGVSFADEQPRALAALENASSVVEKLFKALSNGRHLSALLVEEVVRPIVSSVLRHPDAFFWVEGLRGHGNYAYRHAISTCALAALFGRHMGFVEDTIISLAAGGLLMDAGKQHLPPSLLQYQGELAPDEMDALRNHVTLSLNIMAAGGITNPDVLDGVRTHHERYNGSGYPDQLFDTAIPLGGRMLGIIDAYDAMIAARPYRTALSRYQAMRQLYSARDVAFAGELVDQFQACMGVYPTGSLVELNSGEVAVVMAQNPARRLRPKVAIVSTPSRQPSASMRVLDLSQQDERKPAVDIARTLAAGDYDLADVELSPGQV